MRVDELGGPRWELALDLLRRGEPISVAGVGLWLDSGRGLAIQVASSWLPHNVTERTARQDLQRARSVVSQLLELSEDFAALATGRTAHYQLVYDWYKGAALIGEMDDDGRITWASKSSGARGDWADEPDSDVR